MFPFRHFAFATIFPLVVLCCTTVRADEQADLRAIVDKAIETHGGEAKLTKLPAETWKESGVYHGGGNAFPYDGTVWVHYPSRMKMQIENVYTFAVDGDRAWFMAGGNTNDLPKERLDEQKEVMYADWIATLVPLKGKEFKLAALGESTVENKPAVGIRVSSKDHRDVSLFFDKGSGLLVKAATMVKSREQGDQEVTQEKIFLEYADVQGTKTLLKHVTKRDGKLYLESTHAEVKRLEKLDDGLFAKP